MRARGGDTGCSRGPHSPKERPENSSYSPTPSRFCSPLCAACSLFCPLPPNRTHALLFGLWNPTDLGPEYARALTRIAFKILYRDLTLLETDNKKFIWQSSYLSALYYFRSSLLRFPRQIQLQYARTAFSGKSAQIGPKKIEMHLNNLIRISPEGSYELTEPVTAAIDTATARLDTEIKRRAAARARRRH